MSNAARLGSLWTVKREVILKIGGLGHQSDGYVKVNGTKYYPTESSGGYTLNVSYGDTVQVHTSFGGSASSEGVPNEDIQIREKQLNGSWVIVAPFSYDGYSFYADYQFTIERSVEITFFQYSTLGLTTYSADIKPI